MRRDAQAVLLLLVGGTLLKVSFAGTYVRYVKPGQLPLLLIAGTVLIAVAGVTLWRHVRADMPAVGSHRESSQRDRAEAAGRAAAAHEGFVPEPAPDPEAADAAEESEVDGHGERSRIGWLLLVPALALLIFSPPALGSFSASRNGTALGAASTSDFAPLPAGDPVPLPLLDYAARSVFDKGRSLGDRPVLLTGFVIAGPRGEPYLARLFVGCCAADARPLKVGLTGDLPPDLRPDQWIEVTGRYTEQFDKDPVNGEVIPYVAAISVRHIAPPEEQYET
jgi:uncharacterized repeat protein (TIGR03943 family)